MFTFEQPMNQLMRMPCTAMLRYTRWAHCAYGMLWKKPSCFYHSVGGEGLPLKTCPHEPSWKHPRALGKKMSSAWNKKRYKSAIPTLCAETVAWAVSNQLRKIHADPEAMKEQLEITAEAAKVMKNTLQNQGATQPLHERLVATMEAPVGNTTKLLKDFKDFPTTWYEYNIAI